MKGIKKHRKGFSLMEVMVSIALIGILFTPMLTFFSHSTQTNIRVKNIQRANTAAQAVMEEFRSYQTIADIAKVYSPATANGGMYKTGSYTERIYNIDDSDGKTYYFQKNGISSDGKEYIARVKVDTTVYNDINNNVNKALPVISSLGSDTTVVALEQDETLDKIREFKTLYFNATGHTDKDIDYFAKKLKKTMKVEITDTDEAGNPISTGMVHVRVYSEYTLTETVEGCGNAQIGPDIYNGLMEESQLKGIYVFFNFDVTETGSLKISQGFDVSIDYQNPPVGWKCGYKVYAICQGVHKIDTDQILKDNKDDKAMTNYIASSPDSYMTFTSSNSNTAGEQAKIWTNFPIGSSDPNFCEKSTMDNIVETETIQRLSVLTVSIYNKDDLSRDIVTIDSTRGE